MNDFFEKKQTNMSEVVVFFVSDVSFPEDTCTFHFRGSALHGR
jgi:hypothetical protein